MKSYACESPLDFSQSAWIPALIFKEAIHCSRVLCSCSSADDNGVEEHSRNSVFGLKEQNSVVLSYENKGRECLLKFS